MADKKVFYKSKTFWFNALILLIGIVSTALDQLSSGIPITVVGILGIVLRTLTKEEIDWTLMKSR